MGVPITHISFPHSPSPMPSLSSIMHAPLPASAPAMHMPPPLPHLPPEPEPAAIPHYHKLSFPTYDGKDDPLGWLNRCDRFFRAQRTPNGGRVWLTSFHLTGSTQQWYYVLERDTGEPSWDEFKRLCHQCFRPLLRTKHLAELVRLSFSATMATYQEFQALSRTWGVSCRFNRLSSSPAVSRSRSALMWNSTNHSIFNAP